MKNMAEAITIKPVQAGGGLGTFERYFSVWVALCMVAGIGLGKLLPAAVAGLRGIEFGKGSQINAPIAVLIWLMITPMMMKVDFSSVKNVGRRPAGLLVTLFINWVVKPFSMALLAWAFSRVVFAAFITPAEADQYIAGCIILAAAPCTVRSSGLPTSLNWPWQPPLRYSGRNPARRWQRSSAFWWKCRSCFPSARRAIARGTGFLRSKRVEHGKETGLNSL